MSSPQARQAPTMASGPTRLDKVGWPDQDRTAAPATRHAMPSAMRRSKFSRKMNQAISAVATPSSVSNSEAAAASVRVSPTMRRTGPTMPPATIAPESQGRSALPSAVSLAAIGEIIDRPSRRKIATPRPAPQ